MSTSNQKENAVNLISSLDIPLDIPLDVPLDIPLDTPLATSCNYCQKKSCSKV
jgi:hypothetical protein